MQLKSFYWLSHHDIMSHSVRVRFWEFLFSFYFSFLYFGVEFTRTIFLVGYAMKDSQLSATLYESISNPTRAVEYKIFSGSFPYFSALFTIVYIAMLFGVLSGSRYWYGTSRSLFRSFIATEISLSFPWKRKMASRAGASWNNPSE